MYTPTPTPLTDRLEAWWTPEKFTRGTFNDGDGRYCAIGAADRMGRLGHQEVADFVHLVDEMTSEDRGNAIEEYEDDAIVEVNDGYGRTAVLSYLRRWERTLRTLGRLS